MTSSNWYEFNIIRIISLSRLGSGDLKQFCDSLGGGTWMRSGSGGGYLTRIVPEAGSHTASRMASLLHSTRMDEYDESSLFQVSRPEEGGSCALWWYLVPDLRRNGIKTENSVAVPIPTLRQC